MTRLALTLQTATLLILTALPSGVAAQSATTTGQARAAIIEPLRATPIDDLSFGTLTVGMTAGGEVRVSALGSAASYSGSAAPACGAAADCAAHAARFAVSGEAGRVYRVHLPSQVIARGARAGQLLYVSQLSVRSDNAAVTGVRGLLDRNGRDAFSVGGVLAVPAATTPDTYRAELTVSVTYD